MRFITRHLVAFTAIFSIATTAIAEDTPAEKPYPEVTIYEAEKIITMEPGYPEGKYVATSDGIILAVAQSLEDLAPWTDGRDVTINRNFADKMMMPGFIEPHIHPMLAIMMLPLPFISPEEWDLPGTDYPAARSEAEYEQQLREELAKSDAPLFMIWGHHQLFHGPMDRDILDRIAPDRAVLIWQRSFHEAIANTKALELLNIGTEESFNTAFDKPDIAPGHADFASGIMHESALPVAIAMLRPYLFSPDKVQSGLVQLRQMLLENGVTTTADMAFGGFGGPEMESQIFKNFFEQPSVPTRILAVPVAPIITGDPNAWLENMQAQFISDKFLMTNRVKLFADGAFFAQYMQMNAPGYSDGHEGKWITEPEDLQKLTERFWDAGWHLHTHVNGDKGLEVVLDITEKLTVKNGQDIVLEHVGYSSEAQNRRIDEMGLYVSAQPNYIRVLGDVYGESGLGPDRAAQINRLGSLERKGVPMGLHSDFNMAPIDPLYLAWIASNRITLSGNVKAPAEKISLDKAMRAITIEAAQIIGMDDQVGSIAAGKKADFVVLDRNPYDVGAENLRDIIIHGVVFEGQWFPAQ